MVLPPLNFHGAKEGYHTIGLAVDYVNDFPFTGMAVLRPWADAHRDVVHRLIAATDESIAWFEDPSHRAEAIELLVSVGKATPDDAAASYDFLRKIDFFERSAKVSRVGLQNLITVESSRGLVSSTLSVDRLVMTGITELGE